MRLLSKLRNALLLALLAWLGLELALQAAHFALFARRDAPAGAAPGAGAFRVLCIGESTTVGYPHGPEWPDSYPNLLARRLAQEFPGLSFEVENRGRNAATSAQILDALPGWLERQRPHAVIAMLGANDVFYHAAADENVLPAAWILALQNLRTWRLAGLVREQLRRLGPGAREAPLPDETLQGILGLYERGVLRFDAGDWSGARSLFRRSLASISALRGDGAAGERVTRLPPALLGLYHQSISYLAKVQLRERGPAEAIRLYRRAIEDEPELPILRFELAHLYEALGRRDEAARLREQAQALLDRYVLRHTQEKYRRIRERVEASGALLVAMQYPLRDVNHLKILFADRDGVAFVDNRDAFARALAREPYPTWFSDRFAGDFGHLTARGNALLVENLMDQALRDAVRAFAERSAGASPAARAPRPGSSASRRGSGTRRRADRSAPSASTGAGAHRPSPPAPGPRRASARP